jgi:alpha-glucan,water dikinase
VTCLQKTPLSVEILNNWHLPEPPKYRLTVQDLLQAEEAAGRHIGLILDLSNHDCLYASDIPPGVQYLHVHLVAKELPPLEFVHEVGQAASKYWATHDDYIAIHCAYGFNRTGFVVCSYLIESCGLSVEEALNSFASSRPPGVKHEKVGWCKGVGCEQQVGFRDSGAQGVPVSVLVSLP